VHSYKYISQVRSLEELISIQKCFSDTLVKNCMLFLMRNNIMPVWEDCANMSGGCVSYRVGIDDIPSLWNQICNYVVSENITTNHDILQEINGITISPKKNFGILKIWMKTCDYNTIDWINPELSALTNPIFKKHI
jgi:hypothetical protein